MSVTSHTARSLVTLVARPNSLLGSVFQSHLWRHRPSSFIIPAQLVIRDGGCSETPDSISSGRSSIWKLPEPDGERIGSVETRFVTGRSTLGIRWPVVGHSLLCLRYAYVIRYERWLYAQHSFIFRWAFVLYVRSSLTNIILAENLIVSGLGQIFSKKIITLGIS